MPLEFVLGIGVHVVLEFTDTMKREVFGALLLSLLLFLIENNHIFPETSVTPGQRSILVPVLLRPSHKFLNLIRQGF